jgi:multicomponent Na+:H+ antiporter subunit A
LWHGVNTAFILSVLTLLVGAGLFAARDPLRAGLSKLTWRWGPSFFYDRALDGLNALARGQTKLLQSGYLRFTCLPFCLRQRAGRLYPVHAGRTASARGSDDIRFYEAALGILILEPPSWQPYRGRAWARLRRWAWRGSVWR